MGVMTSPLMWETCHMGALISPLPWETCHMGALTSPLSWETCHMGTLARPLPWETQRLRFDMFGIYFWDLRFWRQNIWDFEKIRFSHFEILKNLDFIEFSKIYFVINTHSILTNKICMNSYTIRIFVSTCQNIRTVMIKEIRVD